MTGSNQQTVAALYQAFSSRDFPAILRLVDPEIVVYQTSELPWGGTFDGVSGLQEFFAKLLQHLDSRVDPKEYIVAGDRVVAIGRTRGTIRATNAPFDVRVTHVWTVKGGRACRFEAYIDTPEMLRLLGGQEVAEIDLSNGSTEFRFVELTNEELPWELLLLADPSRSNVEQYIQRCRVIGLSTRDGIIGVAALYPHSTETIELKNIAIAENHSGRGLGRVLLDEAIARAKKEGASRMTVGTGNSSLAQLRFYQRAGFRITGVDEDFFVRNYSEVIFEGGVQCRDMVLLEREL